jgi:hypothetical protein
MDEGGQAPSPGEAVKLTEDSSGGGCASLRRPRLMSGCTDSDSYGQGRLA